VPRHTPKSIAPSFSRILNNSGNRPSARRNPYTLNLGKSAITIWSGTAKSSDFVGEPNAERPPATAPRLAVAAEDPPGPQRFSPWTAVVIAAQEAVPNQRADHLAVRAGRLLEPFGDRQPLRGVAVKPTLLAHGDDASAKSRF
jgi:hypothetical protein